MSTIGSQISLWLGMSVISGFEILEYIVQVFMVLTGLRKKSKDQKVPRNECNATAAVWHEASWFYINILFIVISYIDENNVYIPKIKRWAKTN